MTVFVSLLFALLLLPGRSLSIDGTATTAVASVAVYPSNASRIDLSNQGLEGRLVLTFHAEDPSSAATSKKPTETSDWRQVTIETLNLSGNPRLTSFSVALATSGKRIDGLEIGQLDIGGTQMAPLPGRLFQHVSTGNASRPPLISISVLSSNGTAVAEPLDINLATDYMYSLRVETFSLTGWKLINESSLPANITSHRANSCASKRFNSPYVTRLLSTDGVDLVGVAGTSSLLAVSDTIDLSSNTLRTLANVTFSARTIDLSNNRLVQLPNVVYRPGSVCGAVVTGSPTLLLRRNRLSPKVLDNLSGQKFSGLDLAENLNLSKASLSESSIHVSEFLDLSGLWGSESELSSLLTHFRHFDPSASVGTSTSRRFRLSLADNWLPDLATAAELVDEFLRNGDGSNRSVHLDISGNPRLVHLNLSDLPANSVASLTVRRLPHLHSASVRVDGDAAAAAMERLRRSGQRPNIDDLVALLYQRGSTLRLDAQPNDCCLRAHASELVCSFEGRSDSTRSRGGSVFCYGEEDSIDDYGYGLPPHPPELPLLFSCVVLGVALLLGLVTGIAFFYARRRSRGKYAVYSAYDVQKLKSLQQQQPQPPHQLASVGRNHAGCGADPNGRPVLLKAVSVVQLPIESTDLTNATEV